MFVYEKIYDQFVVKSCELVEKWMLVIGDFFDFNIQYGLQVRGVLNMEMINFKILLGLLDKVNCIYVRGNFNYEIVFMDKRKYSFI